MDRSTTPERASWLRGRRLNEVERFDTRFAADYDRHWGQVMPTHARMLARFLALCPDGADILDAACGTGKYWPAVLASGRRPHGIDQSREMLRLAGAKHPEIATRLLALTDLDDRELYEGVLCADAMEYVPPEEWPVVLRQFRRALRPGGHLYLTVEQVDPDVLAGEHRWSLEAGHPVVEGETVRGQRPDEDDGYHYYPTREEVMTWLDEAGFDVLDAVEGDEYLHVLSRRR